MKLNSKVTGGLAWAGLVLVLAVPSADILTKPQASTATITSDMDAIRTASITPAAAPAMKPAIKPVVPATRQPAGADVAVTGKGADVVDDYVSSGKKLPSYISDVSAGTGAQQPATGKPLIMPTTTAKTPLVRPDGTFAGDAEADAAAVVAPKPYPASMRPKPTTVTAALPANDEAPLIIGEQDLERREAALQPTTPFASAESPQIIGEDQLEEWDSGSLAEYLERRGLVSDSERAAERLETQFDADGFFLSDGPNNSSAKRRRVNNKVDFFLF